MRLLFLTFGLLCFSYSAHATRIIELSRCSENSQCIAIEGTCEPWQAVNKNNLWAFGLESKEERNKRAKKERLERGCNRPEASQAPKVLCVDYHCKIAEGKE